MTPSPASRPWLLVAGDFSPLGGMDRANFELAKFLSRGEGAVHLIAHRVEGELAARPNVIWHKVSRPGGIHALGGMLLARAGRKWVRRLRQERPFVIVNGGNCRAPGANWVHYLNARYRPRATDAPLAYRLKNRFAWWRGCRSERRSLRIADLVIANSERTRADLVDGLGVPPSLVQVVYYGMDAEAYRVPTPAERTELRRRLGYADGERIVVFVGALGFDQRKGFDVLLRALPEVKASVAHPVRVVVLGSGAIGYWQTKIAEAPGLPRIEFAGLRGDVADHLGAADLLVSPTRYEAYGMAVHEAVCRGLPTIVAADAGVAERYPAALSELLLPDVENWADLAARMREVLLRPERFRPAIEALSDSLRRWTWTDMADRIVSLCRERS